MSRYRVLPYKQGSRGAKALADALGGKVLRLENSVYRQRPGDIVINWGNSRGSARLDEMLNGEGTARASNKLYFFAMMNDHAEGIVPEYWTSKEDIPDEAFPIVCRTVLDGHSGVGIVIAETRSELVDAPLYVKYIKKQQEYRVHVGRGQGSHAVYEVIAVQRKARDRNVPDHEVNWSVRNHKNGFNFVRNGFNTPNQVTEVARKALEVSRLDFGAVDVVYNEKQDKAYVLEINTAPGLEGQTVEDYKEFFKKREVTIG